MPRRRTVITFAALTASALLAAGPLLPGCGASENIRNEDPPPASVSNACGDLETGPDCEGQ